MTDLMEPIGIESKTISSLCVELLADCQARLLSPSSLEDEALVHDIRVATKRLRSAWHLVHELSGAKIAKERRKDLQKMSAHLSFRRDAAVLEELARELGATQTDPESAAPLERIAELIRQQPTHSRLQPCSDGLFEEVRDSLADEIAAWDEIDWSSPNHARKAIRRTLRKTSSRVRRDTVTAQNDKTADVWHEWRKAIKRLRYQREFVAEASGRMPGKFDARLSRLGTALGHRNDLANLLHHVEREVKTGGIEKKDLKALRPVIGRAEQDLLRNCRRLGRRLMRKG